MFKRGFTLIELLVVIAIIAILAAILFPVFAKAREKARQTTCLNNERQVAAALLMFVQDHDETFPTAASWLSDLTGTYGVTGKVWDCPTSSFKGTESAPDYFYAGGSLLSNAAMGDITQPADAPMIADLNSSADNKAFVVHSADATDQLTQAVAIVGSRHNNGANFAFVDGHTTWISKEKITPSLFAPSVPATAVVWPIDMGEIYKNDKVGSGFYTKNIGEISSAFATYGLTRVAGTTGTTGSSTLYCGTASGCQANNTGLPNWLDKTLSLPASQLALQGLNDGYLFWGTSVPFGLKGDSVMTPSTFTFTLVPTVDGAKKIAIFGAMQEAYSGVPYFTIPTITYYTNATKTAVEKTVTMSTDCKEKYDGWIAGQGAAGDVRKCQARARMIYLKLKANKAIDITVYINHNGSTVAQQQAIWMLFEE